MRILYITAHYPPDFTSGATLQVRRLAELVAAFGHDVTVISGAIHGGLADGETRVERLGGVTVHWIGTASRIDQDLDENWINTAATKLVATVVERTSPDIVHAHALQTLGADFLLTCATAAIPTIVTMHDFWWWCPRLFLVDRDMQPCPLDTRSSDCSCARSAESRHARAEQLARILGHVNQVLVPSRSVREVVIANGLDPAKVEVDENDVDQASIASEAASRHRDVRFVYVGGDHPLKGRDVLFAAVDHLRDIDGWQLRAYGTTAPRRRGWRRPRRRVEYLDAYDSTTAGSIFRAADVLVIPSIARESYSIAAREALGSGLAVITSDCLGPTEVVHDGLNGLIVPIADPVALAAAMRQVIVDRSLLGRFRATARSDPPRLRSPSEHATTVLARYQQLLGAPT